MLSDVLKQLVLESGKTQKDIAADLGLIPQRFNFYVNGIREPDAEMLVILANYFDVSVDYLLGQTDKKNGGSPAQSGEPSDNPNSVEFQTLMSQLTPEEQKLIVSQIKGILSNRE